MAARAHAGRAPRPRARRRVGPSRIRWDRVGRIALVLVLFGVMVSYLNPAVNLIDAWRDSKAGEERLAKLKAQKAKLERQVSDAASPLEVERQARRLGMVKPGESGYVVRY
jgi:cell division protein FtsB